jgi:vitamin B12 transporter
MHTGRVFYKGFKMIKPTIYLSLLSGTLITAAALAEEIEPEIIVTANRSANTVDETLSPVTVITRNDIDKLQAKSVNELLSLSPGVDFVTNGGFGSNQSIFLRGTNSNQVLVLIDGVPSGSATLGTTPFQYLPLSQIERIEIVRGPHSSLYGSSAIGGVIQIFTRKKQQGTQINASTGYGSDNTSDSNVSFHYGDQKTLFNMGLAYLDSDGYNVLGTTPPDDDDDGYDNLSFSINASQQLTEALSLSASYLLSDGTSEYDGNNDKKSRIDFKEQVSSISAVYQINDQWQTQLQAGQSSDDLKDHRTANVKNRFKTTKDSFTWKNEWLVRNQDLFTAGFDYLDESVNSTTNYTEDSRWNRAAFTQYQYYGDTFDIKASWRFDDNEAYGSHNTGSIGIGFDLDPMVRVTTSYGSAFKAPTFNSLYWPREEFPNFFYSYEGNPDLKPEKSESFEFGLSGHMKSVKWTANYYNTQVRNLISTQGQLNPVTFFWEERPENIGKANIDGIELSLQTELFGWLINSHFSHTDPRNTETGELLPLRSQEQFRLDVDKNSGKFGYGATIYAASERYTSSGDEISGYGIMNLRVSWKLNQQWSIRAKIDNVLDKEYATTQSFNGLPFKAQDRFAFASIHYQM